MNQKIRIKLRSYDHNLVDKSTEKIVKTVKNSGAVISGPIPLPTEKEVFTVLRSPHVNKKAREQFEVMSYKRLIDIYSSSSKTISVQTGPKISSCAMRVSGVLTNKVGGINQPCSLSIASPPKISSASFFPNSI